MTGLRLPVLVLVTLAALFGFGAGLGALTSGGTTKHTTPTVKAQRTTVSRATHQTATTASERSTQKPGQITPTAARLPTPRPNQQTTATPPPQHRGEPLQGLHVGP